MKRLAMLIYGVVCYVVFFATFLYAIGFIGNLIVPKSIDSVPTTTLGTALLVNTLLLVVFAVQHSVMARPWFKRAWTRIVPVPAERSTYVLFSSLALVLLFALWQPMGGVIWNVQNEAARMALYSAYGFGWALVLVSTFAIWATPAMTVTHLFFAVVTSAYILVAIQFEEHDLKKAHPEYDDYKRRVPMLIPAISRLFRKPAAPAAN